MNTKTVAGVDASKLGEAATAVAERATAVAERATDATKSARKMGRKARKKTRKSLRRHPATWGAGAVAGLVATGTVITSLIRRRSR
jgi:hypothetical protein